MLPIPGTSRVEHLEENVAAVSVNLTPDDLREIDTASSSIKAQGARYPEHLQKMVGR